MPLDGKLLHLLGRLLSTGTDRSAQGYRLLGDAQRLWSRAQRLLAMNLIAPSADRDALQLACYALQLPLRQGKVLPAGRLGQTSLRDRAEQSAELLISLVGEEANEQLLERTSEVLREIPQRSPSLEEARLLADAVNLDDFGVIGLVQLAMHISRFHGGIEQVIDGYQKRQQYGYWEARLKDGFHFEPVRQMARQRMEHIRSAAELLLREVQEDQAP